MASRLRDVAMLAGVSIKTASNVVNHHPHVRPSTRAKVESAISELGYRPNVSARQLKYGRSGFLALVVPEMQSPYFAELAAKFSEEAATRGYLTLFETTGGEPQAEAAILDGLPTLAVDGIVFSPLTLTSAQISERASSVPMALLGERVLGHDLPLVAVDSVAAAAAMTEHLISLGRTRIAAIGREVERDLSTDDGVRDKIGTASVRLLGYRQAMTAAGLEVDPAWVRGVSEYSREGGRRAMQHLLALPHPPDAVFCFNDLMAIGAIRACHEAGLRIPDDVAIAGFDNIAEGRFSTPTLTTIAPDLNALVTSVLDEVLTRVEGALPREQASRVQVPWQLLERESTLGR